MTLWTLLQSIDYNHWKVLQALIYDDIYDPDYGDMLRVSFMHKFRRGKLADLVSLLSGRDFETKEYRDDIVDESYRKLDEGIQNFINEYNFAQFIMAIKGAGFISHKLLNSAMTLDFAYTLYLMLLDDPTMYFELVEGGKEPARPLTFVFGAKASPGYDRAKQIINLINNAANLINNPECTDQALCSKVVCYVHTYIPLHRFSRNRNG